MWMATEFVIDKKRKNTEDKSMEQRELTDLEKRLNAADAVINHDLMHVHGMSYDDVTQELTLVKGEDSYETIMFDDTEETVDGFKAHGVEYTLYSLTPV